MTPVIENGILKKGAFLELNLLRKAYYLYIPAGVRKIDRCAFPFADFISLNEKQELVSQHIVIWGANGWNYGGRGVYPIRDDFIRDYLRKHGTYSTDADYHANPAKSPEFMRYARQRKKAMIAELCRLLNRLPSQYFIEETAHFRFDCSEQGDGDEFWNAMFPAIYGLETEQACYDFLKKNLDEVIDNLLEFDIASIKDELKILCRTDLLPESKIDIFIENAIEEAQESKDYELQLLLMNYKTEHFPHSDAFRKFEL